MTGKLALMITLLSAVERTTLQNTVPVLEGRVLGRYSSPLFKLNSCRRDRDQYVMRRRLAYDCTYLLHVEASGLNDLSCTTIFISVVGMSLITSVLTQSSLDRGSVHC